MPTLEELQLEVARLRDERARLEAIRNAKLESIRLKLGNIPRSVSADHPVLSAIGSNLGRGGIQIGKALYNYSKPPKPKQKQMHIHSTKKHKHRSQPKSLDSMKAELAKLRIENQLKKAKKEALAYA